MSSPTKTALGEAERLAIVDAIADAERGNVGEVRVHLEERCPGDDALTRAKDLFRRLGLHQTKRSTGVLIYVATLDRRAAVYAAEGLHGATDPSVWQGVVGRIAAGYGAGRPGEALVEALGMVGEILRQHAAGHDEHGDELPNEVSEA